MCYVSRCPANRRVCNADLKVSMLSVGSRRESVNEFQTIGAATQHDLRLNLLRLCQVLHGAELISFSTSSVVTDDQHSSVGVDLNWTSCSVVVVHAQTVCTLSWKNAATSNAASSDVLTPGVDRHFPTHPARFEVSDKVCVGKVCIYK